MTIHAITRRPRFARLRRGGVAGVVAVLAGLALAPAAGAATVVGRPPGSPGPSWSITPTPNPPGATGVLRAVSCTAANACTAVGTASVVRASAAGARGALERRTLDDPTDQPCLLLQQHAVQRSLLHVGELVPGRGPGVRLRGLRAVERQDLESDAGFADARPGT